MALTPHLPLGPALYTNILSSVESFLNSQIITPYAAAVVGTQYANPLQIIIHNPDDLLRISGVPVIVLEDPMDEGAVYETGFADGLVWNKVRIMMCVYPAINVDTNGIEKPILASDYILRGLFKGLSTALTLPLLDFTTVPTPTIVDYAFLQGRIINDTGAMKNLLAINKHRFSYELLLKFAIPTLQSF